MRINFTSINEMLLLAETMKKPLSDVVLQFEMQRSEMSFEEVWSSMTMNLEVMRDAVKQGLSQTERSFSGLVGGDASR